MVLMLQKEVAERIGARDGKESILSLSVKAYGTPHYMDTVKRGSFTPAPKVDSAIISIENISKKFFAGFSEEKFFEIVRAGFARGENSSKATSKNSLRKILPKKRQKISGKGVLAAGLSEKARAEDLTLEKWKNLAEKI